MQMWSEGIGSVKQFPSFGNQRARARAPVPVACIASLRSLATVTAGICKETRYVIFHSWGQNKAPL